MNSPNIGTIIILMFIFSFLILGYLSYKKSYEKIDKYTYILVEKLIENYGIKRKHINQAYSKIRNKIFIAIKKKDTKLFNKQIKIFLSEFKQTPEVSNLGNAFAGIISGYIFLFFSDYGSILWIVGGILVMLSIIVGIGSLFTSSKINNSEINKWIDSISNPSEYIYEEMNKIEIDLFS